MLTMFSKQHSISYESTFTEFCCCQLVTSLGCVMYSALVIATQAYRSDALQCFDAVLLSHTVWEGSTTCRPVTYNLLRMKMQPRKTEETCQTHTHTVYIATQLAQYTAISALSAVSIRSIDIMNNNQTALRLHASQAKLAPSSAQWIVGTLLARTSCIGMATAETFHYHAALYASVVNYRITTQ